MYNKKEEVVDKFLESNNMDYLFCILAEKEAGRLSSLPDSVKKSFKEKPTTMALQHIALNNVPDYIVEEIESKPGKNDEEYYYEEEYQDDSQEKTDRTFDQYDNFDDDEDDDFDEDDDYDEDDDF